MEIALQSGNQIDLTAESAKDAKRNLEDIAPLIFVLFEIFCG